MFQPTTSLIPSEGVKGVDIRFLDFSNSLTQTSPLSKLHILCDQTFSGCQIFQ